MKVAQQPGVLKTDSAAAVLLRCGEFAGEPRFYTGLLTLYGKKVKM